MNHKSEDEMNYSQFYVQSDDPQIPSKLSVFRNDKNMLFVEISDMNEPENMYSYQFITMNAEDARALLEELSCIVHDMEQEEVESKKATPALPSTLTSVPTKVDWENFPSHQGEDDNQDAGTPIPAWALKEKVKQHQLFSA